VRPLAGDGWDGGNPGSDVANSTTRPRLTPRIRAASAALSSSVIIGIVRDRGVQDQTSMPQANLPAAVAPRPGQSWWSIGSGT
jgi:hypothetical protein